jgi:hypothetical protein
MTNRKIILYIILLTAVAVTAYIVVVVIPTRLAQRTYEGAQQLGKDIKGIFNFTPEVTVNNTVVIQQQAAILELATLSQSFSHQYKWSNTRFGSTKEIQIEGSFVAKVGFDLDKRFAIQLQDEKAIVLLPEPRLLSLEPLADVKFEDENGIINWVDNNDRSTALNSFQTDARQYAQQADFIGQAKIEAENKIKPILLTRVKEVEFRYVTEPIRIEKQ